MKTEDRQEKIKVLASQLTQVAPYIFRVKQSNSRVSINMCESAIMVSEGVYRISDPVCRELEQAGCEDHTESGNLEKMQATKKITLPVFQSGSYYR